MNKLTKQILFFATPLALTALISMGLHTGERKAPNKVITKNQQRNTDWNKRAVDAAVSRLRQGNVVLRMGTGAYSHLLARMNRTNKNYSHCGIVLMEHGYPFVYHSIGGEENPDARLRRDSAARFFSPRHNTAIAIVRYAFTPGQEAALKSTVSEYYSKKARFDTHFDLSTDDKLYCTEFVYKAITTATRDTGYIPTSTVLNKRFVGADNLFVNGHASLICELQFK